jgi:hypothetical protein
MAAYSILSIITAYGLFFAIFFGIHLPVNVLRAIPFGGTFVGSTEGDGIGDGDAGRGVITGYELRDVGTSLRILHKTKTTMTDITISITVVSSIMTFHFFFPASMNNSP